MLNGVFPAPQTFWEEITLILLLAWPITLGLLIATLAGIIIGLMTTFRKAGFSVGAAVVPIYNLYVLGDIADVSSWYISAIVVQIFGFFSIILIKGLPNFVNNPEQFAIAHILLVGIFVMVYALNYAVSKKFDKGFLFSTGLTFLPFVFWPILGLGSAEYQKSGQ